MDPNQTLKALLQDFAFSDPTNKEERKATLEKIQNLATWIAMGGFYPKVECKAVFTETHYIVG